MRQHSPMNTHPSDNVFPPVPDPADRAWRWGHLWLFIAVAAVWLLLSFFSLWMGELNQDEGWYLYAARQLASGPNGGCNRNGICVLGRQS